MDTHLFEENPFLHEVARRLLKAREQGQLLLQNGDSGFASAPSNIALLKYWGKKNGLRQIPVNSSLSLSLGNFRSVTCVSVRGRFFPLKNGHPDNTGARPEFTVSLNGRDEVMPAKMEKFLRNILAIYAPDIALHVLSQNNFPTACGVASSASGYAALAGAVADLLNLERFLDEAELALWINEWSRLGSGSATRSSVMANKSTKMSSSVSRFVAWELCENADARAETPPLSRTLECVAHSKFQKLRHCLLVLDSSPKATGSSEGHELAQTSVLQSLRLAQYPRRYTAMLGALAGGDFGKVAETSETDAFEMHAVMATGAVPLQYMSSLTSTALKMFVEERNRNSAEMFWTLDAGPNPHFLFDAEAAYALADVFAKLGLDDRFKNARVLLPCREVPQELIVGLEPLEKLGFRIDSMTSEPMLENCDLLTASQILCR